MSKKYESELQNNESEQASTIGRRGFIQSSTYALLAGALVAPELASAADLSMLLQGRGARRRGQGRILGREGQEQPYFTTRTYTVEELEGLYRNVTTDRRRRGRRGGERSFTSRVDTRHMIFYYDEGSRKLVNPTNVQPSLSAGKYSLVLEVMNTHVSQQDYDSIWKGLKNDAQMQVSLTAPSANNLDADDLTWTLMNAIDIFLGGKADGIDKRLKLFTTNNKPTEKFRPSEKVEVLNGSGKFLLQLAAQKKDSWWRKLLTIGGAVLNSPFFATLPIPKLLPEGLTFATTVLDHIKETEKLTPVWTSANIPFNLYNGATPSSPFKLRPGLWLTIDRTFAAPNLDANGNLNNYIIDIPGEFFELKNTSGQPADANYSVLNLTFPPVTT